MKSAMPDTQNNKSVAFSKEKRAIKIRGQNVKPYVLTSKSVISVP